MSFYFYSSFLAIFASSSWQVWEDMQWVRAQKGDVTVTLVEFHFLANKMDIMANMLGFRRPPHARRSSSNGPMVEVKARATLAAFDISSGL